MRSTCPCCGAALPQHEKGCAVVPLLELAAVQGAQKALQDAAPMVKQALMVAQSEGVHAAAGQISALSHGYTLVKVQDLRTIAGFACEHFAAGHPSCDEADEERGGCCNACWAARWARRVLDERRVKPSEPQNEQK